MVLDPSQPFTHAQAVAAGVSWRALTGRRYQRLLRGIYVSAGVTVTAQVRARAALLAMGGIGAICSVSAAELRELPVPVSENVHMLVPPEHPRSRRPGIVTHRGTRKLSSHLGIPLTTMRETFLDVATDYPLVDAVALGDAMVIRGYATSSELVDVAAASTRRGVQRARRAAALVRPRVDSPRETRLRLLMLFNGLPEPVTGHAVAAAGRPRYLDTAYPEWHVAVEYDGRHHKEDQQWSDDIVRREELGEVWDIVTVTGRHMWNPDALLARIRATLERAGARLPPPRQDWRAHFPQARPLHEER